MMRLSFHKLNDMALVLGIAMSVIFFTPALAQVKRVEDLTYPPLPEVQIPEPTRAVLENGLVVLLLEDHELPLVNVTARIRTGSRLEPNDKVGLAALTGTVWRSGGTKTVSGDALDDYLEGKAAHIETSIGENSGSASMSSLREDFPDVLKIFADVLRNPLFDEEKLSIAKNKMMASISRQNDDPDNIVSREFRKLVYGTDSPYARTETYATVRSITREDLIGWHQQYVQPAHLILGLVGDFKADEALDLITKVFGDWERKPAKARPAVPYRTTNQPGVFYAEKNDMTQSKIIMGHLGLVRTDPDYYAVVVMNQILSGSFSARLFSNIRSKKGLAYDVHGGVGFGWDHPGAASLFMSTKTETTNEGIDALQEEANKMVTDPPTDKEVENARRAILNSFVFQVDSPEKVLGKLLTYEYFGYPNDWLTRFRKGIEQVTTKQVRAAAKKHLNPEQFAILVVGPGSVATTSLARYDSFQKLDITIPES